LSAPLLDNWLTSVIEVFGIYLSFITDFFPAVAAPRCGYIVYKSMYIRTMD
jgi:hypothetical protein